MKQILFYSIVAFGGWMLTGCNTMRRTASKTVTEHRDLSQLDKRKDSSGLSIRTNWDSIYWRVTENKKLQFRKLEYDTDKPIDSITGKPPLKSETQGEIDMSRDSNGGSQSKSEAKDTVSISEQDHSKIDIDTTDQHEIETKKKSQSFPWLLVGVILVALAWTAWKRRRS
ncbi:hypothetical protein [uncultured Rikenella sp.]|uniref:hypothetical protein n=1 Tax=uncultured Rikenella sp. TaxID=368003 RepID=UPI00262E1DCE|nr:hypothetical protein [uncultured Rikenella sp.]